jgi:hypothetical protein
MLTRTLSILARLRVTVTYALMLVGISATLLMLDQHEHDRVISHFSTNLHNLAHGHLGTLIASAFVTDNGPMWIWLPGLMSLLALAELLWHSGRTLVTFALGHIGATLIVAAGLAAAVKLGWMPLSVSRASDVGISYGAAALLGALTAAIPSRWRSAWIGWWVSVGILVVGTPQDFSDGGHFVALLLGIAVSFRLKTAVQWTRAHIALMVVGVAFGYLVLVNTGPSVYLAPVVGALGATAAHWLTQRRRTRRSAAQVDLPAAEALVNA